MIAAPNAPPKAAAERKLSAAKAMPPMEGGLLCSVQPVSEPLFDENYLRALAARDPVAENSFVEYFTRPVRSKLRARLRSQDLVRDASQETFLRVFRYFQSGKTLENPASLPGFVHTVCHNVSLELLRSFTRQSQVPENAPETEDPSSGPEALAATSERSRLVSRVLEEMHEKDRRLIRRVCLDEEDKDAVCREFGVDRAYLRVLLHRARIRFRDVMEQSNKTKGGSAGG
jgi:RNA polymerase sigma-70 factor (ECF subfamily)